MTSVPATNTEPDTGPADPAWILGLLQAGDSFYPTGSYAHSFGIEGLVLEGVIRDRDSLREFILLAALPALARCDLPLTAHAWRALAGPDWDEVGALCVLSSALRAPREVRLASENIGRQRAELLARLHANPLAVEFCRRAAAADWPGSAPVAAALEGRVHGAPLSAVLAGVCYATLASVLSAAMKLLRLGQNGAQSLLAESLARAPAAIAQAAAVARADLGWFNPWLDIAAARHERADARLFLS